MAGFCWYERLGGITMEIMTTMEASRAICQTAVTTRQLLINLPDTKTSTNRKWAGNVAGRGGGWGKSVKWVTSLCTFPISAFKPLQSRESFWGVLLCDDWQTVQEADSPAALTALTLKICHILILRRSLDFTVVPGWWLSVYQFEIFTFPCDSDLLRSDL